MMNIRQQTLEALNYCLHILLIIPGLLSIIYNNYIAYNFNLPNLSFWFFFLTTIVFNKIINRIKTSNKITFKEDN